MKKILYRFIIGILICTPQLSFCPDAEIGTCAVCRDELVENFRIPPCGHGFHRACHRDWLANNPGRYACWTCRAYIAPYPIILMGREISPVTVIKNGALSLGAIYILYVIYDYYRSINDRMHLIEKIDTHYDQSYAIDWNIV